ECGIPSTSPIVGLVGRYNAMKDHSTFVRAAAVLNKLHPDVHYVLAGTRVEWDNAELSGLVSQLQVRSNVHMLGRRQDMERVTAALDIACSSSAYGEGFPNVIGEAMSCAVPCVVTDVGDSARIVSDT